MLLAKELGSPPLSDMTMPKTSRMSPDTLTQLGAKQNVGSAGGATGFWGRWEDYVRIDKIKAVHPPKNSRALMRRLGAALDQLPS